MPVDFAQAYMWFSVSEGTLSGAERDAARVAKEQAAQAMMADDLDRAVRMAQQCLASGYQNCQ